MKRTAFKMHLNEGQKEAYIKRHDEIWPELEKLLRILALANTPYFSMKKQTHFSHSRRLGVKEVLRIWGKQIS